jgi:hypothetical protein
MSIHFLETKDGHKVSYNDLTRVAKAFKWSSGKWTKDDVTKPVYQALLKLIKLKEER